MPEKLQYSPPGTVPVEINVPEESKELIDAAIEIMKDAREGKNLQEVLVENWVVLVNAFENFQAIPAELRGRDGSGAIAYFAKRIGDFFGI